MKRARRVSTIIIMYGAVVGVALGGIAFGLTAVVKAATGLSQQTQREQSLLDRRMESSREIRQALAKPLPRPEPLPPITARVAHDVGSGVVASRADRRKLMDEARDAFAGIKLSSSGVQSSAYAESDRHAVR